MPNVSVGKQWNLVDTGNGRGDMLDIGPDPGPSGPGLLEEPPTFQEERDAYTSQGLTWAASVEAIRLF